jgi:hypothetical protein
LPFVFACSAALLSAQERGLRPGETVQETRDVFPGTEPKDADGDDTIWCVRIVDAIDRRPIAGALVMVPWHPGGGVVDAELHHQCIGIADEHGWARLPWPAVYGFRDYVFADAPGYAATERCYPGNEECALQRGVDVPVELVDYTGRPVPGGRIELVLGCGHVPPQRSVVADAQGRAVLPAIWPSRHEDFFVWAEGCQYGAYQLRRTWRPGDPPVAIDVVPGRAAEGRVVDATGAPIVGARVGVRGQYGQHPRPWTRTDRDGRFRLVGLSVEEWPTLAVQPPPHLGCSEERFPAPPPGVVRTVLLGRQSSTRDVVVRVRGASGEPASAVRVVAVRAGDGTTAMETTGEDGSARFSLPTGHWRLLADGELGPFGRSEREFDVAEGALDPVELVVPKNPTVRVDASRIQGMTFGITTARQFRGLDPEAVDGKDVPIPEGERATFRISLSAEGELLVRFVEIPGPGATLVLEGPPEMHVRARFVGPDGKPTPGELRLQRELGSFQMERGGAGDDATPSGDVVTRLTGTVTWIALPKDETLASVRGDIVVASGQDVDLGEIRFAAPSAPDLTVVLPPDLKEARGTVRGTRVRANGGTMSHLDEQNQVASGLGDFAAGDRLLLELAERDAPGALPFPFLVPGPPPWTLTYPTGSLTLGLRSAKDLPLAAAVVIVDGRRMNHDFVASPSLRLRGVAPGPHTVVVAERAHLARVFQLVATDGEARTLDVVLTPRER